nr:hypothetical protein [Tanacetum cinerariifolium]
MVREHIGLKILSWKKVKSAAAKMARSKSVYQHTMGRGGYTLMKEKIEKKKLNQMKNTRVGTLWLKGRVNKDGEYPDDEIRSVGDKLVDHGTDAMTVVLCKEKGGYARGVGSGVTYKRIIETQAIDDPDPLVNNDNDNENDDLGYQSEEYFEEVQEDDENNHSNGNVVKRGITRLYKFRRKYEKPDGIKLSVIFDALNRISGKHRALFRVF